MESYGDDLVHSTTTSLPHGSHPGFIHIRFLTKNGFYHGRATTILGVLQPFPLRQLRQGTGIALQNDITAIEDLSTRIPGIMKSNFPALNAKRNAINTRGVGGPASSRIDRGAQYPIYPRMS